MVEAKQRLLAEIAEQLDLEYRVLLDGLRQDELLPVLVPLGVDLLANVLLR